MLFSSRSFAHQQPETGATRIYVHIYVHIGAGYGWISVDVGGISKRKYFQIFNDLQSLLDAHGIR